MCKITSARCDQISLMQRSILEVGLRMIDNDRPTVKWNPAIKASVCQ